MLATISIGIDPFIHLGPVTVAWHGLTIAVGIVVGGLIAAAQARRRGLDPEPISTMGIIAVVGGLVGGRAFYLAEHGGLGDPGAWLGNRGFTFYGGLILTTAGIGAYLWRKRLTIAYLDAVAPGLALGYAIGRIGDIINGEHYGPATSFLLGVRNTHPDADVPSPDIAYHNGGLYEMLIGLVVFVVAWALRDRLTRPTAMASLVVCLLAAGRFFEFFVRSDSATLALGLETAQWVSLVLVVAAGSWGVWLTRHAGDRRPRSAAPQERSKCRIEPPG